MALYRLVEHNFWEGSRSSGPRLTLALPSEVLAFQKVIIYLKSLIAPTLSDHVSPATPTLKYIGTGRFEVKTHVASYLIFQSQLDDNKLWKVLSTVEHSNNRFGFEEVDGADEFLMRAMWINNVVFADVLLESAEIKLLDRQVADRFRRPEENKYRQRVDALLSRTENPWQMSQRLAKEQHRQRFVAEYSQLLLKPALDNIEKLQKRLDLYINNDPKDFMTVIDTIWRMLSSLSEINGDAIDSVSTIKRQRWILDALLETYQDLWERYEKKWEWLNHRRDGNNYQCHNERDEISRRLTLKYPRASVGLRDLLVKTQQTAHRLMTILGIEVNFYAGQHFGEGSAHLLVAVATNSTCQELIRDVLSTEYGRELAGMETGSRHQTVISAIAQNEHLSKEDKTCLLLHAIEHGADPDRMVQWETRGGTMEAIKGANHYCELNITDEMVAQALSKRTTCLRGSIALDTNEPPTAGNAGYLSFVFDTEANKVKFLQEIGYDASKNYFFEHNGRSYSAIKDTKPTEFAIYTYVSSFDRNLAMRLPTPEMGDRLLTLLGENSAVFYSRENAQNNICIAKEKGSALMNNQRLPITLRIPDSDCQAARRRPLP